MSLSDSLPEVESVTATQPGYVTAAFKKAVDRTYLYDIEDELQALTLNDGIRVEFGANNSYVTVACAGTADDEVIKHLNAVLGRDA